MKELRRQHPFIQEEEHRFLQNSSCGKKGKKNKDKEEEYEDEYSRERLMGAAGAAAEKRLERLRTAQSKLGKRINKKVVSMMEAAETEYGELQRKR